MTEPEPQRQRLTVALVLLLATLLVWGGQSVYRWLYPPPPAPIMHGLEEATPQEELLIQTLEWFTVIWVFYLGACVGSFLNVVAGRLPAGQDVIATPSACPRCGKELRASDNLPIFGYWRLGGRCRWCQTPIPLRYLLVELIGGGLMAAVLLVELTSGGANLPGGPYLVHAGVLWTIWYPRWSILSVTALHALLVVFLFLIAQIRWAGARVPRSVWMVAVLAVIGLLLVAVRLTYGTMLEGGAWRPGLTPHPVASGLPMLDAAVPALRHLGTALLGTLTGIGVGGLAGWLVARGVPASPASAADSACTVGLIGAVLGWQAVFAAVALFLILHLLVRAYEWLARSAAAVDRVALLAGAGITQLFIWRSWDMARPETGLSVPGAALLAVLVAATAAISRRK